MRGINNAKLQLDTTYDTMLYYERRKNMSKWEKLIARVRSLDKDLVFDELRKVLEAFGYTMYAPRGGSSHYTFRKKGREPITIPKHKPIKLAYIKKVRDVVESEVMICEIC